MHPPARHAAVDPDADADADTPTPVPVQAVDGEAAAARRVGQPVADPDTVRHPDPVRHVHAGSAHGVLMSDVVGYRKRRGVEAVHARLRDRRWRSAGTCSSTSTGTRSCPPSGPGPSAVLAGIGLVLHLVIRWRLPYADPLILPLVMLLNGLGLAMIHRLDLGTDPVDAQRGTPADVDGDRRGGLLRCVIVFLRDYRVLQRYTYTAVPRRHGAAAAAAAAGARPGEERRPDLDPRSGRYSFQPAELAKIVLSIAFASYLVEKRDVLALAGGTHPRHRPAPAARPRPDPA